MKKLICSVVLFAVAISSFGQGSTPPPYHNPLILGYYLVSLDSTGCNGPFTVNSPTSRNYPVVILTGNGALGAPTFNGFSLHAGSASFLMGDSVAGSTGFWAIEGPNGTSKIALDTSLAQPGVTILPNTNKYIFTDNFILIGDDSFITDVSSTTIGQVFTKTGPHTEQFASPASGIYTIQNAAPTTGTTVTSNGATQLVLNPAGTLAALTVAFPASPTNGQLFSIASTQIITALTLTSTSTINGTITTLAANGGATWVFDTSLTAWIRK